MGKCKFCGKPTRFFRRTHAECDSQYQAQVEAIRTGTNRIVERTANAINGAHSFAALALEIDVIERSYFVSTAIRKSLLINGWERAVDECMEDGLLNEDAERRLISFLEYFDISSADLAGSTAMMKYLKAGVLRRILGGVLPPSEPFGYRLPINLQRGEHVIWVFPDSRYLEDKTRRQYVGGSHGVSVKIMSGVYYRVGAFKGHAVEHIERVHIDTGWVVVTNRNIYFAGPRKSLRLPYSKIVSIEPFSDGIGVTRDSLTARPQVFLTGDGWFTYNLVINLSQMPGFIATTAPSLKKPTPTVECGVSLIEDASPKGTDSEVARVYREAARAGDAESQVTLAYLYEEGIGTPQNLEQALYWYTEAAGRKHRLAQFQLGALYAQGKGVALSKPKAYKWWLLAAAQGDDTAARNAIVLMQKMTERESAEAHHLVAEEINEDDINAALQAIKTTMDAG